MSGGASIPFTQYLLPHGERRDELIEVAPDIAAKAASLIERGFTFECEILRTGQVSVTITDPQEEIDADIRVIANGPGVREAVEDMVRSFDPDAYAASLATEPQP